MLVVMRRYRDITTSFDLHNGSDVALISSVQGVRSDRPSASNAVDNPNPILQSDTLGTSESDVLSNAVSIDSLHL
jgi:hypothetical protein